MVRSLDVKNKQHNYRFEHCICGILHNIEAPVVTSPVLVITLVQFASLGSGSHSPFLIHVAESGPVNISPSRQLNVTFTPSSAGSS